MIVIRLDTWYLLYNGGLRICLNKELEAQEG